MRRLAGLLTLWLCVLLGTAHAALDQTSNDTTADNVGSTQDVTFSVAPTAGCAIFLAIIGYNGSSYNVDFVSDNQGNTYNLLKHSAMGAGDSSSSALAWATAVAGGVTTVTINNTFSSGNYIRARAFSWCGIASGVVDASGEVLDVSPTTTSTVTTSGSTTQASELVVVVNQTAISSTNVHLQDPASSGYTSLFREQDHVNHIAGGADYKTVSSTGTQSASYTHDAFGSGADYIVIGTFKLTVAGGATTRRRPISFQ